MVARSQNRGTNNRRTTAAHVEAGAASVSEGAEGMAHAGVELFHSEDPGQPCGMVVNAAPAPNGGFDLLAEIKLTALEQGSVHLGAADGPVLAFQPLPYALPSEV